MEKLQQQIHRAQRRLNLQRFLGLLPVCWFATLLVAALAIGIHKWFPTAWDPWTWNLSWLIGALVVGLLAAVVWTRVTRNHALDAAIEIDRRFGLKERVSSSLALSDDQRATKVGRALLEDAQHSVGRLDVTERFGVSASRGMLLPLLPALLPVGPPPEHRLPAETLQRELESAGWALQASPDVLPYQFVQVYVRAG